MVDRGVIFCPIIQNLKTAESTNKPRKSHKTGKGVKISNNSRQDNGWCFRFIIQSIAFHDAVNNDNITNQQNLRITTETLVG